jgi:gliding motility-associated-like protein
VYQLTLHRCTSNNASLNLTVKSPPPFNLGENQIICRNTLTLDAGSGFDSYLWNTGETTQEITVELAGNYSVKVTTENCTVSDGVSILNCDSKPYIPNAFTPDGDGKNDRFFPLIASEVASYNFFVYDRWGKLLFESKVANDGWDGTYKGNPCPVGLYFYCLKYSAETEPGIYKNLESRGGVTLIR